MSWAIFETELIEALMTPLAQVASALAAARDTRAPAATPVTRASHGATERDMSTAVTALPATSGVRLAIRPKCLSLRPFGISVSALAAHRAGDPARLRTLLSVEPRGFRRVSLAGGLSPLR